MFKKFVNSVSNFFKSYTVWTNLESYIAAGNPQTAADVDRLEREYMRLNSPISNKYF